ncbi:hypothetical protein ACH5RR_006373 [Cinchona calisaya]|uniref:xylose isomerase n=1 Tax=Cinchona calisaya TaxID=153742 RepID=A0ABD3ANS6_9GENT
MAKRRMRANFELLEKLGLIDGVFMIGILLPLETNANLDEVVALAKELQGTKLHPLLGTTQLFLHSRYMHGATTSCCTKIEEVLACIADNILDALEYLRNEKSLVFKYLSPSNIFFDKPNGKFKIGDVGTVKDMLFDVWADYRAYMECARYMAPELLSYKVPLAVEGVQNWDVWSLGMCLLEFYLGKFLLIMTKARFIRVSFYLSLRKGCWSLLELLVKLLHGFWTSFHCACRGNQIRGSALMSLVRMGLSLFIVLAMILME